MRRIAIVGCRPPKPEDGLDAARLYREIIADMRAFCFALDHCTDPVLVSGGAEGVDTEAQECFGQWILHEPDYVKHGPMTAPKARNKLIVRDCDELHAWPAPWSRGTWHTVGLAKKAGKPTTIHGPMGARRNATGPAWKPRSGAIILPCE